MAGGRWRLYACQLEHLPGKSSSHVRFSIVSQSQGNDDQVFWGLAAITAAELQYPDVQDGYPWLSLAQGVFNTQVERWDDSTCDGGLRWQLYAYQAGYSMKNTISNGGLFQLSARLARYTNNQTYAEWAERIWDWMESTPLMSNSTWNVADSTVVGDDCTSQGNNQWSYNYGTMLSGAAYMYAYVGCLVWKEDFIQTLTE